VKRLPLLSWLLCGCFAAFAQIPNSSRLWTSADGKTIQAAFVKLVDAHVFIRMANGSEIQVPLARFSPADQEYAKTQASLAAPAAAKSWPRSVSLEEKPEVIIVKESPETKEFIYRSPHYEFQCDSKLGANVVREFGRLFEATWLLNNLLPLDLKPAPEKLRDIFLARLFTSKEDYMKEGAVVGSAGIYMSGKKALMVPLSSLGVKMVGNRVSLENGSDDDNATLIHEITHQMMNHWLGKLPTWLTEGSAEYVEMLEYNSSGKFSLISLSRQLKKYAEQMNGWEGGGKQFRMLDLQELMNIEGASWAAALGKDGNATQNYGSAGMLTYYFYHLDEAGDAAHIIAFYRALESAKTRDEAATVLNTHLLRERTYQQLAVDVNKACRKEGIDIIYAEPGKNKPASATSGQ